jgi:hypothetical protein
MASTHIYQETIDSAAFQVLRSSTPIGMPNKLLYVPRARVAHTFMYLIVNHN